MNSLEMVADLRRRYTESIGPKIRNKNYLGAYCELDPILSVLRKNRDDIIADVHMGLSCISSAERLHEELWSGNPLPRTIEEFEAYSAQTKLPKQRAEVSEE